MNFPEPTWEEWRDDRTLFARNVTAQSVTLVGRRIYSFGGLSEGLPPRIEHVFIFDRVSQRWSTLLFPMLVDTANELYTDFAVFGHTGTLVDDMILFIGGAFGINAEYNSDKVFCLDLALRRFTIVETYGSSKRGKIVFHTADLLESRNEIIVLGGHQEIGECAAHVLYSLNTKSMRWTKMSWKGQDPTPTANHATCVVGNCLYIFGGIGTAYNVVNALHILDLTRTIPTFSKVESGAAPEPRFGTALFRHQGNMFVFGGKRSFTGETRQNDLHRFDLASQTWHECEAWMSTLRPSGRSNHKAVTLDERVLVFGGTGVSIGETLVISFE